MGKPGLKPLGQRRSAVVWVESDALSRGGGFLSRDERTHLCPLRQRQSLCKV